MWIRPEVCRHLQVGSFPAGVEAAKRFRESDFVATADVYNAPACGVLACLRSWALEVHLNTREEMLKAIDDDPWLDARLQEVMDYLELNKFLHVPTASEAEATFLKPAAD